MREVAVNAFFFGMYCYVLLIVAMALYLILFGVEGEF